MSDLRKAAEQALEALIYALHVGFDESSESQIEKSDKAARQHNKAIRALREALAAPVVSEDVRKDAERYRWLRSTTNSFTNDAGEKINVKLHPKDWDKAIDAAIAAAPQPKDTP